MENEIVPAELIDAEKLAEVAEAFKRIAAAFLEIKERLIQAIKPVIDAITEWARNFMKNALRAVATPKEWHIYTHTKKRRIREKYRKRLTRRLLKILTEAKRI